LEIGASAFRSNVIGNGLVEIAHFHQPNARRHIFSLDDVASFSALGLRRAAVCFAKYATAMAVPVRSGVIVASKDLDVDDARVTGRATFDGIFPFVTQPLVKARGLKIVRRQNEAHASASERLGFGGAKKEPSEALTSILLVNPDVREFTTSAPGVSVESCNDFADVAPDAASQQPSVEIARGSRIELVDAIGQERAELCAFCFILQGNDGRLHDV